MEDIIIKHSLFRALTNSVNKVWDKISFWTKAQDVETNSGNDLETIKNNIDTEITNSGIDNIASDLNGATLFINTLNEFVKSNSLGTGAILNDYSNTKCIATIDGIKDYYQDNTAVSGIPQEYGLSYMTDQNTDKNGMLFDEATWIEVASGTTGGGSGTYTLANDYATIIVILYNPSAAPRYAYKLKTDSSTPTPSSRANSDRLSIFCHDGSSAGDQVIMSYTYGWKIYGIVKNIYPFGAEIPTNIKAILNQMNGVESSETEE